MTKAMIISSLLILSGAAFAHDDESEKMNVAKWFVDASDDLKVIVKDTHDGQSIHCVAFDKDGLPIGTESLLGRPIATSGYFFGDYKETNEVICVLR